MLSRLLLILLCLLALPLEAQEPSAQETSALGIEQIEAHPFGLIFRPRLIEGLTEEISRRDNVFGIDRCLVFFEEDENRLGLPLRREIRIRGGFVIRVGKPRWDTSENERLEISVPINSLDFEGSINWNCDGDESPLSVSVDIPEQAGGKKRPEVRLWFDPVRFEEFIRNGLDEPDANFFGVHDASFFELGQTVELEISELPKLTDFFNQVAAQSFALEFAAEALMTRVFGWLAKKLRNLNYAERLSEVLSESDVWREGIRFERKAFQIENDLSKSRLEELTFSFFPRVQDFLFLNSSGIELYFNSLFLSGMQVRQLVDGPEAQADSQLPSMASLERQLALGQPIQDARFLRPQIPRQDSDISLFLTEDIINKALTNIYLENFLRFSTRVDIAAQTKALISPDTGPLELRVHLGSYQPPNIRFAADQLQLKVEDYYLSLETYIEDRVIPSTEVLAQANAVADLKIDNQTQTLNLAVSPNTFSLILSEGGRFKRRLDKADLGLIEGIANELWADFFLKYPELVLFPTLLDLESMALELSDIYQVKQGMILLDFKLDKTRLKL